MIVSGSTADDVTPEAGSDGQGTKTEPDAVVAPSDAGLWVITPTPALDMAEGTTKGLPVHTRSPGC